MRINIEDIDRLRQRAGLGYRRAKEILEQTGGDLLEALIYLEEHPENACSFISDRGREVLDRSRRVFGHLHRTRIKVRVKDKTLFALPATVGAAGTLLFPKAAALGLVGMMLSHGSLELEEITPPSGSIAREQEPGDRES